jgi:hypothetical protein
MKREPHLLLAEITLHLGTDCNSEHFTSGQSRIAPDLTEAESNLLILAIRDMIVQSKLNPEPTFVVDRGPSANEADHEDDPFAKATWLIRSMVESMRFHDNHSNEKSKEEAATKAAARIKLQ